GRPPLYGTAILVLPQPPVPGPGLAAGGTAGGSRSRIPAGSRALPAQRLVHLRPYPEPGSAAEEGRSQRAPRALRADVGPGGRGAGGFAAVAARRGGGPGSAMETKINKQLIYRILVYYAV